MEEEQSTVVKTESRTKTESIALSVMMIVGLGGILAMLMSTGTAISYGCVGRVPTPIEKPLEVDLDKILIDLKDVPKGFDFASIERPSIDAIASNLGLPTSTAEAINMSIQSKNYREDSQYYSIQLRKYKTIQEANYIFDNTNTAHSREVIKLGRGIGDEQFCHTIKAGADGLYYYICGVRKGNIYIQVQAILKNKNYNSVHKLLRNNFKYLNMYDPDRISKHPFVEIQTPSDGELLTIGDYLITWKQQNIDKIHISYLQGCIGCAYGLIYDSTVESINSGDLIRTHGQHALYYIGADGKRYIFPNKNVYKSWYKNFSNIKILPVEDVVAIPIGGNVTYRPGVKIVKLSHTPKIYAVSAHGTLRHITSETIARELYGKNWTKNVDDISDSFFTNYTLGTPIFQASDYDREAEIEVAVDISTDKGLISFLSSDSETTIESFLWHMPGNLPAGDLYRIRIEAERKDYGYTIVLSDGNFTVVSIYNY